jgi:hypothetical protein
MAAAGLIIQLSLHSTAQPLYTRFPYSLSSCSPKVTVGHHPTRQRVDEAVEVRLHRDARRGPVGLSHGR